MAFYPDYAKHGAKKGDYKYDFSYKVKITAKHRITRLSLPENGEVVCKNEGGTEVTVICNRRSRHINLFYRTKDMMAPNLVYAENP